MSELTPENTEVHIANVYCIHTGMQLQFNADIGTAASHAADATSQTESNPGNTAPDFDLAYSIAENLSGAKADCVFWSRDDLPYNVIPLEDGRLKREIKSLTLPRIIKPLVRSQIHSQILTGRRKSTFPHPSELL